MHWKNPTVMAGCFFGGIGIAFGHHFFYDWLSGRPAEHQDWMIRVGTLLAALSKISLSAAISVASTQLIWRTLQKKLFTLEGVSDLFAVTSNPLNLFSLELVSKATVAILCGTVLLFTPLITILAPGSLSVTWASSQQNKEIQVNTLNFSIDPLAEMHEPSFGATTKLYDWVFWSAQPGRSEGSATYSRSSSVMGAVVYQTTYGGDILQGDLPCGANCSFSQTFYGPSYQCKAVDASDASTPWCIEQAKKKKPCIEYNFMPYLARNSSQDFCEKYLIDDCSSFSTADEWMDGAIWLAYTYLPLDRREGVSDYSWRTPPPGTRNYTFRCEQWTTKFDIIRTYTDSRQHIDVEYTYERQVPYFPVAVNWKGSFSTDKYFGQDYNISWQDYASFAVHEQLYSILKGEISSTDWNSPLNSAQLEGSRLVEDEVWPLRDGIHKPLENLNEKVEELSRNVTLSLFSVQNLVYSQDKVDAYAEINNFSLVFHYDWRALVITYGVAVFFSLVIVIIGTVSFMSNGCSMDANFLTMMVTTRNDDLDDLARGSETGAQPFPKRLLETKVRFEPTGRSTGTHFENAGERNPHNRRQQEGLHRKHVRSLVHEPSLSRPGFKLERAL